MPTVPLPDGLESKVLPAMQIGPLYIEFTLPNMDLSTMPPTTISPWWTAVFALVLFLLVFGMVVLGTWGEIKARWNNSD